MLGARGGVGHRARRGCASSVGGIGVGAGGKRGSVGRQGHRRQKPPSALSARLLGRPRQRRWAPLAGTVARPRQPAALKRRAGTRSPLESGLSYYPRHLHGRSPYVTNALRAHFRGTRVDCIDASMAHVANETSRKNKGPFQGAFVFQRGRSRPLRAGAVETCIEFIAPGPTGRCLHIQHLALGIRHLASLHSPLVIRHSSFATLLRPLSC